MKLNSYMSWAAELVWCKFCLDVFLIIETILVFVQIVRFSFFGQPNLLDCDVLFCHRITHPCALSYIKIMIQHRFTYFSQFTVSCTISQCVIGSNSVDNFQISISQQITKRQTCVLAFHISDHVEWKKFHKNEKKNNLIKLVHTSKLGIWDRALAQDKDRLK